MCRFYRFPRKLNDIICRCSRALFVPPCINPSQCLRVKIQTTRNPLFRFRGKKERKQHRGMVVSGVEMTAQGYIALCADRQLRWYSQRAVSLTPHALGYPTRAVCVGSGWTAQQPPKFLSSCPARSNDSSLGSQMIIGSRISVQPDSAWWWA